MENRKKNKYSILEFAIPLSDYDDNKLGGYGKISNGVIGSLYTLGGNYGIYDEPDVYDIEEEYLDNDIELKINSKIDQSIISRDIGDKANRMSNFTGAYTNLTEWDQHTTPIMKGISPNITFRNNQGSGKVGKGSSLNGISYPKIQQSPYKRTGTQYGTSRAPLPMYYEENYNPIFSLNDILDNTSDYALLKFKNQENKIKKIINDI